MLTQLGLIGRIALSNHLDGPHMYFLPSLEQAQAIASGNKEFQTSVHEIDGFRLHHFGYSLPGYMDFEDPLPGSGLKAHELRGLTFVESPDGSVQRHLMLRKFHSLNATIGHMLKDLADKPVRHCSTKLDGSLVRFIPLGGRLHARTMKSFTGPHVHLANRLLAADPALEAFVREAHALNLAPCFELVSPKWKIVLDYPTDSLRLIQMRDETTGASVDLDSHPLVIRHGIPTPTVHGVRTLRDLLDQQATGREIEGWVLVYEDIGMVKVKTPWFEDMHDFVFEKRRTEKKMLEMVLNGTLEDAITRLDPTDPAREAAREVITLTSAHLEQMCSQIKNAVASFAGDQKDNAARKAYTQEHKNDPLLGLYMQALKDPSDHVIWRLARDMLGKSARRDDDARKLINQLREASMAAENVPTLAA